MKVNSSEASWIEVSLARFLAIRSRSEYEVRSYLKRKGVRDDSIDSLVSKYTSLGLINDALFAESVAHSVVENHNKGTVLLRQKLKLAGVSKQLIDESLASISKETLYAAMEKRLANKKQKLSNLMPFEKKAKSYNYLRAAGFSSSEINSWLDELLKNV